MYTVCQLHLSKRFLLVSFHVLANPRAKAEAVRKFVPGWSAANKYLVYDKDAKGMYYKPSSVAPHSNNTHCCVLIVGREAPVFFFWPGESMALRPFTGGKRAHDATVAGRQAGPAVSGHSKKSHKKTTAVSDASAHVCTLFASFLPTRNKQCLKVQVEIELTSSSVNTLFGIL